MLNYYCMKLFLTKILLVILLVIFIGLLLVAFLPYGKKYGYYSLSGAYTKGGWIYDRIFDKDEKIDIAFLGTSRTFNSVQDSLIERKLNEGRENKVGVVNLGIPHSGRNLQYAFAKDLLKNNDPSLIIIEVREREAIEGHFAFPYVANGSDIAMPKSIVSEKIVDDWVTGLKQRFEFLSNSHIQDHQSSNPDSIFEGRFGFRENHKRITDEELMKRKKYYQNRNKVLEKKYVSSLAYHYNRSYIKAIHELTEDQCQLVFLYLPGFQTNKDKPYYYDYYKQFGEVWIPPDSLITSRKYFANYTHFNLTGSTEFSNWISDKIRNYEN